MVFGSAPPISLLDHAHRGVLANAADGTGSCSHIGTCHGHHAQAVHGASVGGRARADLRCAHGYRNGSCCAVAYDPGGRRRLAAAAVGLPARLSVSGARQSR